ncbi:Down syndrome cell adhesion molecule-like protein Dscam2 isoform X2 [Schistocerca americana]|uniref:Down syndrome cell adhesion molecule-like protein Dscam2 isoform X2 n=1 Tax=Schistocerca americana TaxID=7009 RepID=UPI001F4F8C12|nr:Down syndrome cell adhesion molecule-like protein Dscam2 isoform X2 [Schistocerca americana]
MRPAGGSLTITGLSEAPEIDPIIIKRDLQLGMRMRLVCVVSKGDFPILIQWLKDGSPIPEDQDVAEKILDEYSSTLSFSSLAVKHNGNYTCQASNAAASRNYSVEIIVNVPPTWRVEPQDMEVIAGQHAMLACAAEGSPAPHIHWMKDTGSLPPQYQELNNTRMNYKILHNGSLLIHSVQPDDRGYYLCQASSGIGSGLSKVAYLSVHVPAKFSTHFTNITVPKGSTAFLNCTVAADKPISITWYQNNRELKPKQNPKINIKEDNTSKGITSTLIFKHVRREDTSSFICVASNKYGKDQLEMKLIVQETPEPPANVHVNNFSSRSVSLSWEEPYNGNSIIGAYIVQYKNTTAVPWHQNVVQVVVGGDQLNVTIKDLRPAHGYQFQIRAENSVGVSNASETVTVTTMEEIPEAPPRDIKVKVKDSRTLLVMWRPPDKNLQNGDILGYYIGYKISNSSDPFHYKTFEVIPGMELQNTLNELEKFTEYCILIQAYNRAGAGPHSKEVTATTEEDVPGAPPTDVRCTALSPQRILVLWSSPPESAINGMLKGYKVLYRSLADWDDFSHPMEQVTRHNKLELSNLGQFCNYSIEVCAFTNKGDGVKSQPIFCRTLEDVPSEPADIKALIMDSRTVLVSWRPPQYPNGRIQKYKVYVRSLDGISLDKDNFEIPAEQTFYTISHLELHHRYEFWVSAFTAVGEGAGSRHIVQAPASHVPARIASFTQQVIAVLHEDLHLSCHSVGEPAPLRLWRKNEKPVQGSSVKINDEWQLYISPVTALHAGNYTCSVENIFGKDEITYYVTVQGNRNKGIPPTPGDLQVTSASISSILLQWNISLAVNNVIQGFYLHLKREFGEWEKIVLTADDMSYLLSNLQCGTRYYLYLQTFNQLGQSSPTPTIVTRTQGSAPVAPSSADLIKVNSTSISLNLSSWSDGGCPITSLVVEYKQKKAIAWTLVSNNIKVGKPEFLVLDLDPETWYTLRITAHNSAGSTAKEYNFVTLTYGGATISPDAAERSISGGKMFYSDLGIIGPTASAVIVLLAAATGLLLYLRRNQEMLSSKPFGDKPFEDLMSGADKKTVAPIYDSDDGLVALSPTPQESVYLPTPVRVSPAHRKGISPYATFRVPLEVSMKNAENIESCVSSGPGRYPGNIKISEMPDSCTESTYSKIQGNSQHSNEGTEWIPLHNLYQAHRY